MIAPSANWGGARGARLPLAVILPACDNDVLNQEGQLFYEISRLDPEKISWASSVWLEHANHNYFNSTLADEAVTRQADQIARHSCSRQRSAIFSVLIQSTF